MRRISELKNRKESKVIEIEKVYKNNGMHIKQTMVSLYLIIIK
jgi:hypothetical protein